MIKKIKFGVIIFGIIVGLMSFLAFPVSARDCFPETEIQRCMEGKMWNCSEQGNWIYDSDCDSGMCLLDNTNCANSEESEEIVNGTFYYNKSCVNYNDSSSCESAGCNWDGTVCRPIKAEKTTKDNNIPDYPDSVNFNFKNATVGDIFSGLLPYIYVIAGLILLVTLVMGGLGLMTAAGNADKMKAGYGKITNALIGFLIIFISYFVVQLVEVVLGIKII